MITQNTARLRVSRELAELETAVNAAIAKAGALNATLATARVDCEIPHNVGMPEQLRMAGVVSSLTKSLADVARVHGGLKKIDREMGYPDEECPTVFSLPDRKRAA